MEAWSPTDKRHRALLVGLALLIAGGTLALGSRASASFGAPSNLEVGSGPQSLASGDLDGDGDFDLVTANTSSGNISVLLGNDDGTFTQASGSPLSAGGNPRGVAIGDLNGDPDPDLAVTRNFPDGVLVLPGNGDGTFDAGTSFATGTGPREVAIGDLDGNGKSDLAITNLSSVNVTILLGDGSGSFAAAAESPIAVPSSPFDVVIGNVDGGSPDLAIGSQNDGVYVMLGNGDGTFAAASGSPILVGEDAVPQSLALGNLNGDAHTDLAVASRDSDSVSVFAGAGDGTFGAPSPFATGDRPESVTIANVNGGGVPDLVVANAGPGSGPGQENPDSVSVLLGNGDGSFGARTDFAVADKPLSTVVSDINADGMSDIAAANEGNANVSILLGTSAPTAGVSPARLDFPLQEQETTSVAQTVTVTRTSENDQVEIGAIAVTGQDADDFAISRNTCPPLLTTLGQACEVDVTFTPSAAEQRFSSLEVEFNGADSPLTVILAGIGSPDETCPEFTIGTPPDCDPIPCPSGFTGNEPVCLEMKATISRLTVKGPARIRKGRSVGYEARITNSGDARATGVKLSVSGRGIRSRVSVGSIEAGVTRKVKIRFRAGKTGRIKSAFSVRSDNAGARTIRKFIRVRR